MLNFKELAERDLTEVFHDSEYFASPVEIQYDEEKYTVSAILDASEERDKKTAYNDFAQGIFENTATLYVKKSDLGFVPRKNHRISVEDVDFEILSVSEEMGEIVLELRTMEE